MALLLNSEIDILVAQRIKGVIGRIGGSVNQLITYDDCMLYDINLLDGGFGKIYRVNSLHVLTDYIKFILKPLKEELFYLVKGKSIVRSRKTIILDIHNAYKHDDFVNRFDCTISSNVIEHSPNPIFLLLNLYYITKEKGYQFHAIPHYKYTFDKSRKPTTLEHIIQDFKNMVSFDDKTHTEEYFHAAVENNGYHKKFHQKYPLTYPFIHFHVFDELNIRALFGYIFEDVVVDVIKTEEFSDNVVLFRNELNRNFKVKYKSILDMYFDKLRKNL